MRDKVEAAIVFAFAMAIALIAILIAIHRIPATHHVRAMRYLRLPRKGLARNAPSRGMGSRFRFGGPGAILACRFGSESMSMRDRGNGHRALNYPFPEFIFWLSSSSILPKGKIGAIPPAKSFSTGAGNSTPGLIPPNSDSAGSVAIQVFH